MQKNKVELIVTLTLIPLLVFILSKDILGVKKKRLAAAPTAQIPIRAIGTSGEREEVKRIKALAWARDPFVFGQAKTAEGGLILNGIVWDEKSPSAVINDKVVRIGDEVDGNRIVDIQKERVILNKDNNTYELNLRRGGE